MLDKLRAVENRYEELCFQSETPDFYADPQKAARLLREKNELEPIVACYRAYLAAKQEQSDAEELMGDPDMKEYCQEALRDAMKKYVGPNPNILALPRTFTTAAVHLCMKDPALNGEPVTGHPCGG